MTIVFAVSATLGSQHAHGMRIRALGLHPPLAVARAFPLPPSQEAPEEGATDAPYCGEARPTLNLSLIHI